MGFLLEVGDINGDNTGPDLDTARRIRPQGPTCFASQPTFW